MAEVRPRGVLLRGISPRCVEYLLFAYENHTPIFINKKNGKIYGKGESYTEKIDAIRLLRFLNYYGLVEGFKRKQRHFAKNLWEGERK